MHIMDCAHLRRQKTAIARSGNSECDEVHAMGTAILLLTQLLLAHTHTTNLKQAVFLVVKHV